MRFPDFAEIPGGEFLMGENDEDKFAGDTERPRHRVKIRPFLLARFPVTVGEFRRFRPGHEPGISPEWPATMVSWTEAADYCRWLGDSCRLPSEAEWEFAARAGSPRPYPWGDTIDPSLANYFYTEDGRKIGCGHRTPPGCFPASAFGLFDMIGNVCEWVADDWHRSYEGAPGDGSAWLGGGMGKVLRGGAWDYLPRLLRTTWRDVLSRDVRRDNVGFRVAANP